MIGAVLHDRYVYEDYLALREVKMRSARDGVRWHLIDRGATYDFSSFVPMLKAAVETRTQVIWNLCHYGWPDGLDILSPEFIDRFARFASAVAKVVRDHSDEVPFYTPVNEMSFFSWALDVGAMQPSAPGRGGDVKKQLVLATIAGCEAIWDVDPRARMAYPEPVIHVVGLPGDADSARDAATHEEAQYEAWDMIAGRLNPQLGGAPKYLDIPGLNFYHDNQWEHMGKRLSWSEEPRDPRWLRFRELAARVWERYRRPLFVSETSHIGSGRAQWITEMAEEVLEARNMGVPIEAVCLYPILDRHGWDDPNHWHNSGLWDLDYLSGSLARKLNFGYAAALRNAQDLLNNSGCS